MQLLTLGFPCLTTPGWCSTATVATLHCSTAAFHCSSQLLGEAGGHCFSSLPTSDGGGSAPYCCLPLVGKVLLLITAHHCWRCCLSPPLGEALFLSATRGGGPCSLLLLLFIATHHWLGGETTSPLSVAEATCFS